MLRGKMHSSPSPPPPPQACKNSMLDVKRDVTLQNTVRIPIYVLDVYIVPLSKCLCQLIYFGIPDYNQKAICLCIAVNWSAP